MHPDPKAFVLAGPTASGKTAVAQYLAERTGSPVISADSMNIYRGMDIGTAKPALNRHSPVRFFGIDLADPADSFSVGDWLRAVRPAFLSLEKTPIVAGGTGLYIKCLLQGLDSVSSADEAFRSRVKEMTLADLQNEARTLSPDLYASLADKENPRRLVRFIEQTKKGEQRIRRSWKKEMPVVTGLYAERSVLYKRIEKRVEKMYAEGLLEEARRLSEKEISSTARQAIGYAEAFAVLRGDMTESEAKKRTVIRTRQLAKRQMTWFRHQLRIEWIDTGDFSEAESLAESVWNRWKDSGPVPLSGVRL